MAIKIKRRRVEETSPNDPDGMEGTEGEGQSDSLSPEAFIPPPVPSDPVYTTTRSAFAWLTGHRNLVLGGLVVMVVTMAGVGLLWQQKAAARASASSQLVAALAASWGEAPDNELLLQRARIVAEAHPGEIGRWASLLEARALASQGADSAAALQRFAVAVADRPAGAETLLLQLSHASLLADSGNLAGAVALLDALPTEGGPFAMQVAEHRARIVDTWGTPQQALEAWQAFVEAHEDSAGQDPMDNPLSRARNRITLLEIEMGIDAPVAAGSDEG